MAAQTIPNYSRDVRHGKSGSGSSSNYGPIPGSPTLTNPDMILPDYDFDASFDQLSQPHMPMWDNSQTTDMRFHPQNQFIAGPISHPTPIIYGNGTMLSDIGEVTEVESVVGKGGRRGSAQLSVYSNDDHVLGSSQIAGASRIKPRSQIQQRERKSSLDSNSTITSHGRGAQFGDFDDAVSVDDVDFQGDDEESMASSYVEGTAAREPKAVRVPRIEDISNQRCSTSSLSDRAEQILANAKQRLTAMEGNLYRAKGSLYSPTSDGSTPSPPIARPATSLRDSSAGLGSGQGHSRNTSENKFYNGIASPTFLQRSASALGSAGGYRQPLTSSRSADALGIGYGASSQRSPVSALDPMMEALSENDGGTPGNSRRSSRLYSQLSPAFGSMTDTDIPRSPSVAQVRDLKHQMKDLRGKISSLKEQARADSMKRRSLQSLRTPSPFTHARWDQALPESGKSQESTPDALTWQAPWNPDNSDEKVDDQTSPKLDPKEASELERAKTADIEYEDAHDTLELPDEPLTEEAKVSTLLDRALNPQNDSQAQENDDMIDDGETWEGDLEVEDEEVKEELQYNQQTGGYDDNMEDDDDEFVDFESESGESSYHDAIQNPVSHEDREDAFDYEHFFLHSAMGSMSQRRRGSWSSVSSDDSVETTRGPVVTPAPGTDSDSDHERRPSVESMASFNSFTTATEGRSSRTSNFDHVIETAVDLQGGMRGPSSAKRASFGGFKFPQSRAASRNGSVDIQQQQQQPRRGTIVHRPASSAASYARHRPSMPSFGSTGTNRSFPLVDKSKTANGILTPNSSTPGGSPDSELKQISASLLNEAATLGGIETGHIDGNASPMQGIDKESQILVERLVASLGKCVLGLTESSRAGSEARMYRRRIDAARRVLEGLDE
ncbi:hypothetical protein FVEN_g10848 [Fusarium venenatum]|uniref:Uncharacterized protein n=1 Tax=Fusarium venenatum TaxID=56646 RepID=A0A2L2T0N7_9HYPO|nr:uncharacterized protein FVRRES_00584 [Fusarium venenatum]KAG8351004.1 hypothetical protein FVEN_g10848 [Fusarium venenatum]KAH7006180.1 hypothetical protein EDB82DRAFT_109895 [Fusarium venenatum]CEI64072.1 unnamed protein product [Fusarium venenatum]